MSRSAASGDFASDVPAEQIAHPFALAQAVDHRVESALQLAEFGAVEHHQIASQIALLDPLRAARTARTGVAVSQDRIHISMNPKISVADAMISTATANWVLVRLRATGHRGMRSAAMPSTGTPEPSSQTVSVRPMMPGANRVGARPASRA